MLSEYIAAAMRKAKYEIMEDDGSYYGEIPGFQGVYANHETLEGCRDQLQSVLEGWIILGLQFNDPFPEVDGIIIEVMQTRKSEAV